jgi:hypothetical protein
MSTPNRKPLWSHVLLLILLLLAATPFVMVQAQNPCAQADAAADACMETYGCQESCSDQHEPPEDFNPADDTDPNDITSLALHYKKQFEASCDYFQTTICQALVCCHECADEMDIAFECLEDEYRQGMTVGIYQMAQQMNVKGDLPNMTLDCPIRLPSCETSAGRSDGSGRGSMTVTILFAGLMMLN